MATGVVLTRRSALLSAIATVVTQLVPRRLAGAISAGEYCPSAAEREVFEKLNAHRRDHGRSPLKLDRGLGAAARHHANDMSERDFFDHRSPNGDSPSDRARDHGYGGGGVAENIAQGYRSPTQVMTGWQNSSGHNANMLNRDYQAVGIGYDPDGNYWVQVFGRSFEAEPDCGSPGPGPDPDPGNRCSRKQGKARKRCVRRRRRS